jgi:hypothetical protein
MRICSRCHHEVRNPRMDLACAKWCASADKCLEKLRPKTDAVRLNSGDLG